MFERTRKNVECKEYKAVTETKEIIYTELSHNKIESLGKYLRNLPDENKIFLISALIKYFWSDQLVNASVIKLITMLSKPADGQILNTAKQILFFERAMGKIPDTQITVKTKKDICKSLLDPKSIDSIDYHYYEPSTPLDAKEATKFSGKIKIREYQSAIKATDLDISEFILLTLGVFKELCEDTKDLSSIRRAYLERDYEDAILQIKFFCFKNKSILGDELFRLILPTSSTLKEIERTKNYSRRFFENRLGQLYLGQSVNLESVNKISERLTGINFDTKHITPGSIAATTIVKNAISCLKSFYRYDQKVINRYHELIDTTPAMELRKKAKIKKPGFFRKRDEINVETSVFVYTRNKGVMIANQPNFPDETSEKELINRTPDKIISTQPYSEKASRSALAGDLSGNTFGQIAILEQYMLSNLKDSALQDDVNHFIKAFCSIYITSGSHSFHETLDVFHEPHIKKIFTDCRVTLNLEWSDELLAQAANATQEYTKAIVLKKVIHDKLAINKN